MKRRDRIAEALQISAQGGIDALRAIERAEGQEREDLRLRVLAFAHLTLGGRKILQGMEDQT